MNYCYGLTVMAVNVFLLLFLNCALIIVICTAQDTIEPCDNPVYCYGDLLEDVQVTFSLFEDSKQFVDMPMKADPSTILTVYDNISDNITRETLEEFVMKWFDPSGSDLLKWEPPDWTQSPDFIAYISDDRYRQWASDLNALWRSFGKKLSESVSLHPLRHSLLPVSNPFIAAGGDGRFLEYYYWDSFWIMRGLLHCEMYNTTKGMIQNLANLIDEYGFVPNGGRIYYTKRSQPPLLTWMVSSYYNFTNDVSFVREILPLLDKEYQFWMNNRTVFLPDCNCTVNYYSSPVTAPRPESYREDMTTADQLSEELKPTLYSNLASAAESGWDFSSRWLSPTGPYAGQLASIRTQSIIPIDLNAILGANEILLQKLHTVNGSIMAANRYAIAWNRRKSLLNTLFWSEKDAMYQDLLLHDNKSHYFSSYFYSSSIVPLYTFSLTSEGMNISRARLVFNTLQSLGVLDYPGGLPTSLNASGQQWDFPNVWAPLQWLLVKGFEGMEDEMLRGVGRNLALSWLASTYQAWTKYNHSMFEKYNCTVFGEPGGGGEYILQSGFGWTNGVVLDFIFTYNSHTTPVSHQSSSYLWFLFLIPISLIIIVTLLCICCCRRTYVKGKEQFWARIRQHELLNSSSNSDASRSPQSPTIYSNQDAINSDEQEIITYRLSDV